MLATTTWQGWSGTRYACDIHPIRTAVLGAAAIVALAVKRKAGIAVLVATALFTAAHGPASRQSWVDWAGSKGASEIHVHTLADGADAQAIVRDLGEVPWP